MNTLFWIILSTLVSGVLSVLAAGLFLALPARQREGALPHLVSFATGALLGAALLALIPHAVLGAGSDRVHEVGIALIAGIALFFVLEKFLLWRHCHDDHCDEHTVSRSSHHEHAHDQARRKASGSLVLIGDALHNVLDGVLIAAAFLTDLHLGIVTALAIMAHEIPQEVGNFAVLLHSGVSRRRALALNLLTSLTRRDRRRGRVLRARRPHSRCCRLRWPWPPPACCTWRWPISSPGCTGASIRAPASRRFC